MGTYTNYSKLEVDGTISSSVQGELIGTFTSMPSASALNEGKTIYYTGATSGNYVQNTFYTCTKSGSTYSWTSASPKQVSVDSALSETSTNPVQNKVIATALKGYATKDDIATVYKPKGSVASSSLPTNPRVGDVYNLTDNSSYGPAGTNVVYTEDGWDALSGIVDISGKQDKISSGTGISISGNTVSLATSGVTAGTKGSVTSVPVITVDAYGRVTSISSETIYPPTTVGTSGQIWVSDGNGTGVWQSKDTTPTSGSTNAITSGAVHTALAGKQPNLTFDSTPTQNSSNPVTSGGVYNALAGKQNNLVFDSAPTSGSSNPVTSGGIYTAIEAKQSKLTFDSTPTQNSSNPVTSGGIFSAINNVNNAVTSLQSTVAGKQDKLTFDSTPTSGSNNPVTSGGIFNAINNGSKGDIEVVTSFPSQIYSKRFTVNSLARSNITGWGDTSWMLAPENGSSFHKLIYRPSIGKIQEWNAIPLKSKGGYQGDYGAGSWFSNSDYTKIKNHVDKFIQELLDNGYARNEIKYICGYSYGKSTSSGQILLNMQVDVSNTNWVVDSSNCRVILKGSTVSTTSISSSTHNVQLYATVQLNYVPLYEW